MRVRPPPKLRTRYGAAGRTKSRQDAVYHLLHLADALDANSPALFNDYIGWAKVLLQHFGVSSEDLDRHLECMADVVRKQMPPPVAASAVAMIDGARTALPAMPSTTASVLDPGQRLSPLAREYVRTMLGGYRQAARQLVFDAADRGEPVRQLYLQVFQPALREIGRLWQHKEDQRRAGTLLQCRHPDRDVAAASAGARRPALRARRRCRLRQRRSA